MDPDRSWIESQLEAGPILYPRNFFSDDLDQRGVLEVADLGLRVRIIDSAFVLLALKPYPARGKRKILGRVQVGPGDLTEDIGRSDNLESQRGDRNIQRAEEETLQVQAACFEERFLTFQAAVGINF